MGYKLNHGYRRRVEEGRRGGEVYVSRLQILIHLSKDRGTKKGKEQVQAEGRFQEVKINQLLKEKKVREERKRGYKLNRILKEEKVRKEAGYRRRRRLAKKRQGDVN